MPAPSAGSGRQTVADFTTTTKEEGRQMINPTEQKLQQYWDRIQRALQVLQRAQRWHPEEYSRMEERELGDWIAIDDVVKAIQILQEGQQ